jgi:hypothetical protein
MWSAANKQSIASDYTKRTAWQVNPYLSTSNNNTGGFDKTQTVDGMTTIVSS